MGQGKTVLILEDEGSAIFSITRSLEISGFTVLQAFSAREGITIALDKHPDVIITDILMPLSSGIDFLKDLRMDDWGKTAKVIVFSNLSSEEYKANAKKYGVDKYLIKTDTSLKDLTDTVSNLLNNDPNKV